MIRIYENIDCMVGMEKYRDLLTGRRTLAIVDPPYGIGEDGRENHTRGKLAKATDFRGKAKYDDEPPPPEYFALLKNSTDNQIIFGANHFINRMAWESLGWIVWDKDNGNTDFADCELAYTSFDCATRIFKYRWNGMLQGKHGDKRLNELRIHPNHKPIALYRWLLQNYAKPGDLILDTHVGSASSLIACEIEGFEYVGFELDADYYRDSCERRKRHRAQLTLFKADATRPQPEQLDLLGGKK